jgi:hypothetical protein
MLSLESAKKKVQDYLNLKYETKNDALVIREDYIVHKEYGWIFSYESKKYLETKEIRYRRVGNFPLLILKDSGKIYPVDNVEYLEKIVKEQQSHLSIEV